MILNLLCWGILFGLAPPIEPDPFPEMKRSSTDTGGMQFNIQHCWDCPLFAVFGKEFGSTWDPIPVKLFLLANSPALWAARGPEGPWGVAPLNPWLLLIGSSAQWLLLGASWRAWRMSRRAKPSSSVVEA